MMSSKLTIVWQEGLHLRAAALLVRLARRFKSTVRLRARGCTAEAGKIMEVMLLSAGQGTELTVEAEGRDERLALQAVSRFFARPSVDEAQIAIPEAALGNESILADIEGGQGLTGSASLH